MSSFPRLVFLGVSAAAVLSLGLFACAQTTRTTGFDPANGADGGGTSSGDPSSSSGGFQPSVDAGKVDSDGCSDDAKLVYVLSLEGDLYSFAPGQKKFTKVGPLDCSLNGMQFEPISMAVDRKAVAWVNMRAGDPFGGGMDALFQVDTKTAKCTASGIQGDYGSMGGMGFSTNDSSGTDETLFVIGAGSGGSFNPGLNKVDFTAKKLTFVADLSEQVDLELTGTGDGRLYGFLQDDPLGLGKIDKASGSISDKVTLDNVKKPLAPMFAFSFWGGDFFFYTADSQSSSKTTTVARYSPSNGNIDAAYMDNIGFHIVGAGVSTCAPTTEPK